MLSRIFLCFMIMSMCIGCRSAQEEKSVDVTVILDGREATYSFSQILTVDQVSGRRSNRAGIRETVSAILSFRQLWMECALPSDVLLSAKFANRTRSRFSSC